MNAGENPSQHLVKHVPVMPLTMMSWRQEMIGVVARLRVACKPLESAVEIVHFGKTRRHMTESCQACTSVMPLIMMSLETKKIDWGRCCEIV
jgi:hypothetical protein